MTDHAQIPNAIAERMARSAQGKALGLELVSVSPALILKVPYRPELVGDPDSGVIAGGAVEPLGLWAEQGFRPHDPCLAGLGRR